MRLYNRAGVGILVVQPAPNVLAGYSSKTGKWMSYKAAEGVRLIPVVAGLGAGVRSVPPQKEVVAFSGVTGKWATHKVEGDAAMIGPPVVGGNALFQQSKKHVYAFSIELGVWDVLETESAAGVSGRMVIVATANSVSAFSAKTGTWATFKSEPDQP